MALAILGGSRVPSASAVYDGTPTAAPSWMAQLRFPSTSPSDQLCGAILVRPEWVLTAAHCVTHAGTTEKYGHKAIVIRLGRDRLSVASGEKHQVSEIIVHPDYRLVWADDHSDYIVENDVALLHLAKRSEGKPARLALPSESERFAPGKRGTVLGWGRATAEPKASDELRSGVALVAQRNRCDSWFAEDGFPAYNPSSGVCVFPDADRPDPAQGQICKGDSGGPLFWESSTGAAVFGVASFIGAPDGECGNPVAPSSFARVGDGNSNTWILDTAGCKAGGSEGCRVPLGIKNSMGPYGKGWGKVRPGTIYNGGVPNGMIKDIQWERWGGKTARGRGRTFIYKPKGGYYPGSVPADVRPSHIKICDGRRTYTRLYAREPDKPGGPMGPWFLWSGRKNLCKDAW